MEARTGIQLADLPPSTSGERITFADTQVQPRPVITSPEWSGSRPHGRRYSPFTSTSSATKPWHTLSGRQHFFLDHEWMRDSARGCRCSAPRSTSGGMFGDQRTATTGPWSDPALPDPALEVVDPLRVPGQPVHADAVPRRPDDLDVTAGRRPWRIADNDWIEAFNRNGVVACRAIVSHRIPQGTCTDVPRARNASSNVPMTERRASAAASTTR